MEKKNNKLSKNEKLKDILKQRNDPFGSYTGVPVDESEKPLQDADDL